MEKQNTGKYTVNILFFEDCGDYRILKVITPEGFEILGCENTFFHVKDHECEDDIVRSPEFLEYMEHNFGSISSNDITLTFEDEEDDWPGYKEYLIEMFTVENSGEFKILAAYTPGTEFASRKSLPVDTGKIFLYDKNSSLGLSKEIVQYISDISGAEVQRIKLILNYVEEEGSEEVSSQSENDSVKISTGSEVNAQQEA